MPISHKPTAETLPESPSEKFVKEARPKRTVVDSRGRTIVWRTMSILDQAKLYRAVGSEVARNNEYMNLANIAVSVTTIDNEVGPPPGTRDFVEMRMEWVGDEGYAAILDQIQKEFDEKLAVQDAKTADEKFRDDVKN